MLNFHGTWRFDSPGEIPYGVVNAFSDLIGRIAAQGNRQQILEHFKSDFGDACGTSASWSSSASCGETDLHAYMQDAAKMLLFSSRRSSMPAKVCATIIRSLACMISPESIACSSRTRPVMKFDLLTLFPSILMSQLSFPSTLRPSMNRHRRSSRRR